jgi:hypothetical protein
LGGGLIILSQNLPKKRKKKKERERNWTRK